jgi:hypothetical protein
MTPEEFCVLMNASENSDLSGVLGDWDSSLEGDARTSAVTALGSAVVRLAKEGLIEAHLSETLPDETLTMHEVAVVVANQQAWWPVDVDEGLEQVCWLSLTDAGWSALAEYSPKDLYSYQDRRSPA